jgi:hypothetical protein
VNDSCGKLKMTSYEKSENFDVRVKNIEKYMNIFTKKNMHIEVV